MSTSFCTGTFNGLWVLQFFIVLKAIYYSAMVKAKGSNDYISRKENGTNWIDVNPVLEQV